MRTFRLLYKTRLLFYASLLILFYNEFVVYWISYVYWPSLSLHNSNRDGNNDSNLRLLLVADPQLIGDNDEPWYLKSIAKWDSDRYLRISFMMAYAYSKPDVIIFLGDLFDEGLKSTDLQYAGYFKRFESIFNLSKLSKQNQTKLIYISGDNDIGGEYNGDRLASLDKRFESYFGPLVQLHQHKYINFLQLDLDFQSSFYSKSKREHVKKLIRENQNDKQNAKYMIILNHMSIMSRRSEELDMVRSDNQI